MEQLASSDPVVRENSRQKLIENAGVDVTRALVAALIDTRSHVRWEAAKALQAIADPITAAALMNALDDEDEDVRWVAAEALIALRAPGLMEVLSGLIKRARSTAFCTSAHHVLHGFRDGRHAAIVAPVLEALEHSEPGVTAPTAAYRALVTLTGTD